MKTPLIKLLTMGHTLERARDRTGAYTLRYVNKFPKFQPVARGRGPGDRLPPATPRRLPPSLRCSRRQRLPAAVAA
jgi:hypothetical protein